MPAIHILANLGDKNLEPKAKKGETLGDYTDYLARKGAQAGKNRQCSIGWHKECSDPEGHHCKCDCHKESKN